MMTYDSGFRVGELVKLRVVIDMLTEYCKQYKITNWLFPGQDPSKHISIRTAQKIFEHAVKNANIGKNGSFHSLRHTFATHHLEKGTSITLIRDFLGHSSVRTTERYTQIANLNISDVTSLLDVLD